MGLKGKIGGIAKKLATSHPAYQVVKHRKKIVKAGQKTARFAYKSFPIANAPKKLYRDKIQKKKKPVASSRRRAPMKVRRDVKKKYKRLAKEKDAYKK